MWGGYIDVLIEVECMWFVEVIVSGFVSELCFDE